MGNSRSREKLKRADSKRDSRRRLKAQPEDNPETTDTASRTEIEKTHLPTKQIDSNEEIYFQNLGKSLSGHENILESFVYAADAQQGMVDELLNLLEENTENYPDNASQEKNIMPSVMRGAAYILRNMQISSQLLLTKSLKTSFADIRSDINRCLEQFGKDVSIIDVNRQKDIPENLQKRNVEGQMKYLKQTVTEQEKEIKEIQRQNRILQNEIEQYRPENVSATVQLLNTLGGNSVDEMEKELKTTLTSKLGTMNFITCQSASDLDDKKLVIVLCIVSTRLRADAAKAIKDIKNPGNAALLIIHITEAHYLPNQNSSSNLTDQNFKKLRHIFDMAFKSGNGFFQCDMNERSINELCSFCKKHPYGDRF